MKKIFKLKFIVALSMSVLLILGGCAKKVSETDNGAASGSNEQVKTTKKIVMGTSADYPPYEFHVMVDGKDSIVGFDIDIAKEIAKDLGAELEIKDMDFDGLLAALAANKVDMVIAGMTPTDERKKSSDFSQIYYKATHGVVMKKGEADKVKALEDLNGKVVGVQQGTIQADMAKERVKDAKEIKEVPKITDLILMLQTGKVDAIIMEKPVAESYTKTSTELALTAVEVTDEDGGSAVAIKKGNTELVDSINKTIDRLVKEDKINQYLTEANKLADAQTE